MILFVAMEHETALVDLGLSSDVVDTFLNVGGIFLCWVLFAGLIYCLKDRFSYIPKTIELSKEIADGNLTIILFHCVEESEHCSIRLREHDSKNVSQKELISTLML